MCECIRPNPRRDCTTSHDGSQAIFQLLIHVLPTTEEVKKMHCRLVLGAICSQNNGSPFPRPKVFDCRNNDWFVLGINHCFYNQSVFDIYFISTIDCNDYFELYEITEVWQLGVAARIEYKDRVPELRDVAPPFQQCVFEWLGSTFLNDLQASSCLYF